MTRRELLALAALVAGSRFKVQGSRFTVPGFSSGFGFGFGFGFGVQGSAPATLKIGIARGDGYRVETMPLERYASGVIAGEMVRGSARAALEALAIAVRTFAVANLGRHRSDGFDL
ncbi:MAG TPA: SpoIID/LytB domain-containing protein, partial [Vicinamibacterales bacterium]|nr:SpoIID/LytB domain-containing protein [Vicinamibacterales bacterium]